MTDRQLKLQRLQDLIIENAINQLEEGEVSIKDMSGIITLLKNNQIVEDKNTGMTEGELMDSLVEDIDVKS